MTVKQKLAELRKTTKELDAAYKLLEVVQNRQYRSNVHNAMDYLLDTIDDIDSKIEALKGIANAQ